MDNCRFLEDSGTRKFNLDASSADRRDRTLEECPFLLAVRAWLTLIGYSGAGFQSFRRRALSVSIDKAAAWLDASGTPPTFRSRSSTVIARASSTLLPLANSVIAEPHAIDGTQPFARKRMSAIRWPSSFKLSSRMSPHAGFSRRAVESGCSISPGFRGF